MENSSTEKIDTTEIIGKMITETDLFAGSGLKQFEEDIITKRAREIQMAMDRNEIERKLLREDNLKQQKKIENLFRELGKKNCIIEVHFNFKLKSDSN